MKKLVLSLAAIILALAASSVAFAQIGQFEGNWENVDSNTSGVTKLNIKTLNLFGTNIVTLRAFGKCHPTDCDWGTVVATAYAPNVSSNLETTARALTASYNPGFATKLVVVRPLSGDRLQADIYTRFTDGSGRTNYNATYFFKREGVGSDCLFYDPRDLKIVFEGATGWLLTDGRSRMLILDNREDADRALALRFEDAALSGMQPSALLAVRRVDDAGADLWSVLNRVQENLVKGGLDGRTANGRRQHTRPVQGIDQNLRLNRALWLLAEGMRQLKA